MNQGNHGRFQFPPNSNSQPSVYPPLQEETIFDNRGGKLLRPMVSMPNFSSNNTMNLVRPYSPYRFGEPSSVQNDSLPVTTPPYSSLPSSRQPQEMLSTNSELSYQAGGLGEMRDFEQAATVNGSVEKYRAAALTPVLSSQSAPLDGRNLVRSPRYRCEQPIHHESVAVTTVPFLPFRTSQQEAEARSTNSMRSYQGGGSGVIGTVEQVATVNGSVEESQGAAPISGLPSQSGFVRYGSGLTPVFPTSNNSWGPQPLGNPYPSHCFPYNNVFIPRGETNLKRNIEELGNSHRSQQIENLTGHIPGHFLQDSVPQNFLPVHPMFQNPLVSPPVRGIPLNYAYPPLNENQNMNVFPTSQAPPNDNARDRRTARAPPNDNVRDRRTVRTTKRKAAHPSCSSNLNLALEGNSTARLEPSGRHRSSPLQEIDPPEGTENGNSSKVSKSSEAQFEYLQKDVDVKDLLVLVRKQLRNTDVGNLGRVVLPKKEAEANLPKLDAKEGVKLEMEDMLSSNTWTFKYRYWPNNKSRMYVMENTGKFVRAHRLQAGDFFIIYKDPKSEKYIIHGKKVERSSSAGDALNPRNEEERVEEAILMENVCVGMEQGTSTSGEGCSGGMVAPFDLNSCMDKSSELIP